MDRRTLAQRQLHRSLAKRWYGSSVVAVSGGEGRAGQGGVRGAFTGDGEAARWWHDGIEDWWQVDLGVLMLRAWVLAENGRGGGVDANDPILALTGVREAVESGGGEDAL
jgi:hypothetical protein